MWNFGIINGSVLNLPEISEAWTIISFRTCPANFDLIVLNSLLHPSSRKTRGRLGVIIFTLRLADSHCPPHLFKLASWIYRLDFVVHARFSAPYCIVVAKDYKQKNILLKFKFFCRYLHLFWKVSPKRRWLFFGGEIQKYKKIRLFEE